MRRKFESYNTFIRDVKVITPIPFEDDRGFFMEVFNKKDFDEMGIPTDFVQMNHSRSIGEIIRGLHFQWDPPMGKLMRVTLGTAFLVAVDIRKGSPTLGKWYGDYFSDFDKKLLWAPAGFARGICTLSERTEVQYLVTGQYNPEKEAEIKWNDADINIKWPINRPRLSNKDQKAQSLKEWLSTKESENFKYE